jgi:hypothetical protein
VFLGILLTATAGDANGSLFPLAYAVVDAENDDNWMWFNQLLRNVIQQHAPAFLVPQGLTFVSDRQKGLLESVELTFPDSPQGYCLRHLYENMYKEFKHPQLKTFLWQAAEAITEEDFNSALAGIRGISQRALEWLLNHAHPKHWAELYFPGRRYGHTTSNIAESLNAAILEAREKPILGMFEHIRHQLMKWYGERRQIDSDNLPPNQIVVSHVLKKIKDLTTWQARRYRLLPCDETEYEVFSLEKSVTYLVKLKYMTCTCFCWQSTGIPCAHAIAVILGRKEDPQTYTQAFLSLDAYRKSYANPIYPPNADRMENRSFLQLNDDSDEDEDENAGNKVQVIPPHARRLPGRPQKRRFRSGIEGPFGGKRQKKCSRCNELGHARTTCDATI